MYIILLLNILFNYQVLSNNLIIGDSQVISVYSNTKNLNIDTRLHRVGWGINDLINAVRRHPVNKSVDRVFICVGTNDGYKTTVGISTLSLLLDYKFPNAKKYVIVGSYGWGINRYVKYEDVNNYYNTFNIYSIIRLKNEIGYSKTHPNHNTPTIINIGGEIDVITNE